MSLAAFLNPPIVEAVCEFRLPPDAKWDITTPGSIFEKVRELGDGFPIKVPRVANEVRLTEKDGALNQEVKREERVLFYSPLRDKFIQVGDKIVSVHHLKVTYHTWGASFEPIIKDVFNALSGIIDTQSLQRIGLRYINRIEVPEKSDFDAFFKFKPSVSPDLKSSIKNVMMGCVFEFQDGRDGCRLQLADAPTSDKLNKAYILDIDYFLKKPHAVTSDKAIAWIAEAHNKVEDIFIKSITSELEQRFGGAQ